MVQRVLCWIIHTESPISVTELIDATSVNIGEDSFDVDCKVDEDTIRSACSSLLRHVGGNRLEIAHFTVQEYLHKIDSDDPSIGKFKITEENAKAVLSNVCLTYLCMQHFDQVPPQTVDERIDRNKLYPLYSHAANYWSNYAKVSREDKITLCLSRRLFNPKKTYNFIAFAMEHLRLHQSTQPRETEWPKVVVGAAGFRPLHMASMMHLSILCQYLVDEGCNVNEISPYGTPLQFAVCGINGLFCIDQIYTWNDNWNGEELSNTVTVLVNSGANCQIPPTGVDCSLSLLAISANAWRAGVFPCLLDAGMQLCSDLMIWLESGDERRQRLFFKTLKGPSLSHVSTDTKKRLLDVANLSRISVPQALLTGIGDDVEALPDELFRESVFQAIRFEQLDRLKRLVRDARFRNDVDLRNEHGSPLHFAAMTRRLEAVTLLLESDVTLGSTMEKVHGMSVWHLVARWCGKETLNRLVTRFGDQALGFAAESDARTSLLVEAILGGDQASALYLLAKTRITIDNPGNPPLIHLSTYMGMSQLVDRLIEAGFDPKVTSPDGSNALFCVGPSTPPGLIQTLIYHGLRLEDTRADGKTPLHAVLSLDERCSLYKPREWSLPNRVVKTLVSHAVVNRTDKDGNDPWFYFCTKYLRHCHSSDTCEELCKVLIENDALVSHERATGKYTISPLVEHILSTHVNLEGRKTGAPFLSWVLNHHPRLESFLQADQSSISLIRWAIVHHNGYDSKSFGALINMILEKGFNVHARDTGGRKYSALEAASECTS